MVRFIKVALTTVFVIAMALIGAWFAFDVQFFAWGDVLAWVMFHGEAYMFVIGLTLAILSYIVTFLVGMAIVVLFSILLDEVQSIFKKK